MADPADLTATQARLEMSAGRLTPAALAEACLDRVAAREPSVRAFSAIDPAAVRAAAVAAPADAILGGIPIGVKDVIDTADLPTAYGSPIWEGFRPRADAACVAWSRAAGAIVMGKTVTTEFATRTPGPTANPRGLDRTPGGSSSGSAAAVAAGFCPVAFGTQTAGSVIRPAAFCGVVGYKPSFGLIDRFGMKLMAVGLDTIGLMARSVADCALVAGALSGRDLGDPDAKPGRAPRIGVCRTPTWDVADQPTRDLLAHAAAACGRAGAAVADHELPASFADLVDAHPKVMNHESARAMGWEWANHRDRLSAVLRERLQFGLDQTEASMRAAYQSAHRCRELFYDAMGDLDILLTPAAPGEAPLGLDWTGDASLNFIWTILHVPCVTVPAGEGPNRMPLGIQIVARRGQDREALAWARWVEAAVAG